jgi:hypothetical protein
MSGSELKRNAVNAVQAIFLIAPLMACGIPNEIVEADREASVAERAAVAALRQLDDGATPDEAREVRAAFESAAELGRTERVRLADLLRAELDRRLVGKRKIEGLIELNQDLLRCHRTLAERADNALEYAEDGRASRGFRHDVWGLVDPRTCFEELAPAKEELLR